MPDVLNIAFVEPVRLQSPPSNDDDLDHPLRKYVMRDGALARSPSALHKLDA
jgi:hypothetical protein